MKVWQAKSFNHWPALIFIEQCTKAMVVNLRVGDLCDGKTTRQHYREQFRGNCHFTAVVQPDEITSKEKVVEVQRIEDSL